MCCISMRLEDGLLRFAGISLLTFRRITHVLYHMEIETVKDLGSEHLQGLQSYCYVDEMHNMGVYDCNL